MNVIGLLRHGPTSWNRDKRIQGITDIPLDRENFDPRPWRTVLDEHGPWDHIVTSPLSRAVDTARMLFPDRFPEQDPDLCEQDWGDWTGSSIRELRMRYPGAVEVQEALGWNFTPNRGESRCRMLTRVLAALERITTGRNNQRILVVTHFGVIMVILNHLQGTTFLPDDSAPVAKRALHLLQQDSDGLTILQTNLRVP